MINQALRFSVVALALALQVLAASFEGTKSGASLASAVEKLPLGFEENRGQAGQGVKFLARGSGYTLALTAREAWLSVGQGGAQDRLLIRSRLVGADPRSRVEGAARLPGKSNYIRGNAPAGWITDIPTYGEVRYRQVYPGIDLVYYGRQGLLEYDFVVAPGSDPRAIRFAFEGIQRMRLEAGGDLLLETGCQQVRWRRPVIYQVVRGERRPVPGGFKVVGRRQVAFRVSGYDASLPLIIDPVLSYSTYYGGTQNETARGIAADSSGNVYFAGYTTSTNLSGTSTSYQRNYGGQQAGEFITGDAFVAKLNPAGTALVYSTYLGGSSSDLGLALAVDSSGNAYITGYTRAASFPVTQGAYQTTYRGGGGNTFTLGGDAFVTKLNAAGNALVYSTFLGGENDDRGSAIAVDSLGNAYVAGVTMSTQFPVTAGAYQTAYRGEGGTPLHPILRKNIIITGDAFVAKLNPSGSALSFCTYLGGTKDDGITSIAVDSTGVVYVAGGTLSSDFPVTIGALQTAYAGYGTTGQDIFRFGDAFIAKLRADGAALLASTYLGGSRDDSILGLALGPTGDVYVSGFTLSTNFPTTSGAYQTTYRGGTPGTMNELVYGDAFVARLNSGLSTLVSSSYLGGALDDVAWGIAVDPQGNAFVVGQTQSRDFPVSQDASQKTFGGEGGENGIQVWGDAFLVGVQADGKALLYSTYLGGADGEGASAIVLDGAGSGYLTGRSASPNFTTTAGALQRNLAGATYDWGYPPGDVFVAKFTNLFQPGPQLVSVSAASFIPGGPLAPESIVAGFGQGLAPAFAVAPAGEALPTTLAGITLKVGDSQGTERPAPLWFVSPQEIIYLIPQGTRTGLATVTVADQTQTLATGTLQIDAVAPGFFSMNNDGRGVASALAVRTKPDDSQSWQYIFTAGCLPGSCVAIPIDLGPETDRVFLQLYGTGLRGRSSLAVTSATIGGVNAPVEYAGPVAGLTGLDQVNLRVPRSLAGRGEVDILFTTDGKTANAVKVNIR